MTNYNYHWKSERPEVSLNLPRCFGLNLNLFILLPHFTFDPLPLTLIKLTLLYHFTLNP